LFAGSEGGAVGTGPSGSAGSAGPAGLDGPESGIDRQEQAFRASVRDRDVPATTPRRTFVALPELITSPQDAATDTARRFTNAPDTDPTAPGARPWALQAL